LADVGAVMSSTADTFLRGYRLDESGDAGGVLLRNRPVKRPLIFR
jgi:hypothetical protein